MEALVRFKQGKQLFECTRKSFSYEIYNFFDKLITQYSISSVEEYNILNAIDHNNINKCLICQQLNFLKFNHHEHHYVIGKNVFVCSMCSTILGVDRLTMKLSSVDRYMFVVFTYAYINDKMIQNNKYLLGTCLSKKLCSRYFHDSIITFIVGMNVIIPNDIITHILRFIY